MWKAVEIGGNTFFLFNSNSSQAQSKGRKSSECRYLQGKTKMSWAQDWALDAIFMYLSCSKNVPSLFKLQWDLQVGYNLEQELLNNKLHRPQKHEMCVTFVHLILRLILFLVWKTKECIPLVSSWFHGNVTVCKKLRARGKTDGRFVP